MERPYKHLIVERQGEVWCARLVAPRIAEDQLEELGDEFAQLVNDGCYKLVLSLGPHGPECLYSVFLAKLVTLHRRLQANSGALRLAEVGPEARDIFAACHLDQLFHFAPTTAAAVAALQAG